ncbi:MAG: Pseudogene of U32 family peptidase [Methanobrevibacter sp. CfCl-M3]
MVMELLAPAGSYDVFKIAVNAGTDEVYLSGKDFGARAFAENFTIEEIEKSVEYAHLNNVKVFITVNTLINNFEIVKFLKYLFKLYKTGVDAVIVQDFGALKLIKTIFPEMKIHASTQMGLNNFYSLLWASNNGVSRVIFPRELSVNEIADIKSRLNESKISMELEAFAHGAICYSISGKCYISSLNNGRSGNRGVCTQPCRREYILKHNGYKIDNGYLLSTYDLNTAESLDKIEKVGINSIKLEGRMKSEDYVGTIVNSYKNILNNKKEFIDDLDLVFNRKFTKGYLLGEVPGRVMGRESSGHVGFYIGDIVDIKEDSIDYDNNNDNVNYEYENRDSKTNFNKNHKLNSNNYSKTISNNNLKSDYNNNFKKSYNENRYNKNNKKYDYNKKSNHNKRLEYHNKEKNDYREDIYRIKEVRVNKENHIDIQIGDGIAFKYKDKIKGIYLDNIIKQNEDFIVFKTTRNLRVGDKVFISYSHLLHKKLKKYKKEHIQSKIPISLNIRLDENLQISVKAEFSLNNDLIELDYYSPSKFQKAINRPTSLKEIKKQLSKTGNTPFFIEKIEISNFFNDIFIPTSQLNNLRREIIL